MFDTKGVGLCISMKTGTSMSRAVWVFHKVQGRSSFPQTGLIGGMEIQILYYSEIFIS